MDDEEFLEDDLEEAVFDDDAEIDPEIDGDLAVDELIDPDIDDVGDIAVDDEDDVEEIPVARPVRDDDDDDEEDVEDPDDVEEDLDTILKDRIASGDDLDEEDEDEELAPAERNDPDSPEGVTAKREGEFTCTGCFMIVHPRQFGRKDQMSCPEGYEDCPAIASIQRGQKKSKK